MVDQRSHKPLRRDILRTFQKPMVILATLPGICQKLQFTVKLMLVLGIIRQRGKVELKCFIPSSEPNIHQTHNLYFSQQPRIPGLS